MELFDLTMPLGPGLPVQPGDPPLTVVRTACHETHGYEVTQICLGSHSGTHVEAPRHFYAQGRTLDSFPLLRMMGPAVVFDCRAGSAEADRDALADQLRAWPLPALGMALVWTEGRPLDLRSAQVLLEAGAGLVGIDAPSIDEAPYPIHRFLLARDVLIAENLVGLHRLGAGPVECCLLPLSLTSTEAAPARALAWRQAGG